MRLTRAPAALPRCRDAFLAVALESALEQLRVAESAGALYPAWFSVVCFGCVHTHEQPTHPTVNAQTLHSARPACTALLKPGPAFHPLHPFRAPRMASAGVALSFFGGGWWDGAASFLLGCAVGALGLLAGRSGDDRRLLYAYEFIAAAMSALLVRCADAVVAPTCYEATVLSALIWLLQARTPPRCDPLSLARKQRSAGRGGLSRRWRGSALSVRSADKDGRRCYMDSKSCGLRWVLVRFRGWRWRRGGR